MMGEERRQLAAANFARNNSKTLQAVNILRTRYNRLTGVRNVVKNDGVSEDEFLDSVNFLAEEGYIRLRRMADRIPSTLADSDYRELEAKLTGKGIRQRAGAVEDELVEEEIGARSALRAGNFIESNAQVLLALNILAHQYHRLTDIQGLQMGRGVSESEFLDSVNFLAEEGYIRLRQISTGETAELADSDYRTLEGLLTGKGKRLLCGNIRDELIGV